MEEPGHRRHSGGRILGVAGALAPVAAVVHGAILWWVADDAFISFRYARNLVRGLGLVYNAGERVEGFTNPLWTVFAALGIRLGLPAEAWCNVWSLAAYGGTVAVLARVHAGWRGRLSLGDTLPVAAVLAALHPDLATFATSGLETSVFTFLATAGTVLVFAPVPSARRAAAAGLLLALASLTRHDGLLFAAAAGASLLRLGRASARPLAGLTATFLAAWLPFTAWRVGYYGSYLPNTYYAKSADVAWWSQGILYLARYLQRYWTFALTPLLGVAAWILARQGAPDERRRWQSVLGAPAAIAASSAALYVIWVTRVGGDFMFARFLVPATPLGLLVLDAIVLRLSQETQRALVFAGSVAALALAQLLTPAPVTAERGKEGVVDERAYYTTAVVAASESDAKVVTPFVDGLPLVVAIYGTEARFAYRTPLRTVIESAGGLTDAHTAHQPLARRGVPGHEKHPDFDYLILERKAHMTFTRSPEAYHLNEYIPLVLVNMGGFTARLLHWDPAIVDELRRRGALVMDYPAMLDNILAHLGELPDEVVRREQERAYHFYLAHVDDRERAAAFAERLRATVR